MPSLPRSRMAPVWVCPSAAPSLNSITAACGLPTTLRAAQVFTSLYPPKSRHMNDASRRSHVIDDDAAVRAEHWDALELHFLLGLGMFVEDQIHVSAMS